MEYFLLLFNVLFLQFLYKLYSINIFLHKINLAFIIVKIVFIPYVLIYISVTTFYYLLLTYNATSVKRFHNELYNEIALFYKSYFHKSIAQFLSNYR